MPIIFLFIIVASFIWLKLNLIEDDEWVLHTQKVRLETQKLLNLLLDLETGVRGYSLTGSHRFLQPYIAAKSRIVPSLEKIRELVQDNPEQLKALDSIEETLQQNIQIFDHYVYSENFASMTHLVSKSNQEQNIDWNKSRILMERARQSIYEFYKNEEVLLGDRRQHQIEYRELAWSIIIAAAVIGGITSLFSIHLFYQLVTELESRENALQANNAKLSIVCDQLQRFTANASHELRAPLSVILSNSQLALMILQEDEETSRESLIIVEQNLAKISQIAKQMAHLVSDLLFLARHEGQLANCQSFDLNSLIAELAQEWQLSMVQRGITFMVQLPELPLIVKGDFLLLKQAIANLLSNACAYTPQGGKVKLATHSTEREVQIAVVDTGIGIPEAALPHVCDRFYRIHQGQKQPQGFGLGLAIVKQIVDAHQGQLQIHSRVGEGTTVTITLPPSGR
ncbi:CHASE3 domain-containing protein [Thermosynechococcus sp. GLH187]|uniref:sensor histidine kinase n=1 Tax=unclassified Thermosynechococcus TaxID=2622553 RepID=UPI002877B362|nr:MULTISPECIES: CHASE3 domain-containing protein [unclassified Thermosynechococcus]WNC44157.1 CHASE3 domain-containing protein [Thermosynechococcus sp. GLH187]WNC46693.1 CHASE3 domain-containing protein [Thermosynechococcus sp. GLH333]WNC49230.1 CHASE3 domain-containing protein [Thermosynechococcus sp. GLH87]